MNKVFLFGIMFLLGLQPSYAQSNWFTNNIKALQNGGLGSVTQVKLSDTKIGEGLKEALQVGIKNAVQKTGQTDGYFKNDEIKILLPDNLKNVEKGLRFIGMGQPVDDFVLSMNRSAEKAAPLARSIFLDAIFNMSIDDAQKILNGSDTAATDYLRATATPRLKEAFRPIIKQSLAQFNVTQKYNAILGSYNTIPFANKPAAFDPEEYALDKALDGLFLVLGQEEAKIRKDPAARVTDLLKQVFQGK